MLNYARYGKQTSVFVLFMRKKHTKKRYFFTQEKNLQLKPIKLPKQIRVIISQNADLNRIIFTFIEILNM